MRFTFYDECTAFRIKSIIIFLNRIPHKCVSLTELCAEYNDIVLIVNEYEMQENEELCRYLRTLVGLRDLIILDGRKVEEI